MPTVSFVVYIECTWAIHYISSSVCPKWQPDSLENKTSYTPHIDGRFLTFTNHKALQRGQRGSLSDYVYCKLDPRSNPSSVNKSFGKMALFSFVRYRAMERTGPIASISEQPRL